MSGLGSGNSEAISPVSSTSIEFNYWDRGDNSEENIISHIQKDFLPNNLANCNKPQCFLLSLKPTIFGF